MNTKKVALMLLELANLMELRGDNPFKVNAYRRAARALENSRVSLEVLRERPEELAGVGKGTAAAIREILETGELEQLKQLKEELPAGLPSLLEIPGLGPKSIHALYRELKITNLDELEEAVKEGRIRNLAGFGEKKEKNMLEGIRNYRERPRHHLLVHALPIAEKILKRLQELPEVSRAETAGSLRRMKETVKDIDLVVATEAPSAVAKVLTEMPEVTKVVASGEKKVSLLIDLGLEIQVDVRLVAPSQFISTLHHFTGSKEHNVRIRQRAKEFGWKVSEYGICDPAKGEDFAFREEKELYEKLQLPYVAPEIREDRGEFERTADELPRLIRLEDYRGDLHMHTRWSDGTGSIKEMALAAQKRGYRYIAVTDHSQSLRVAGGLTAEDLKRQREEIEAVNEEMKDFTVLAGVEMDILPDGRLDFSDEVLKELDLVIASIHSSFQQDEETITRRVLNAMENPYVHIIAHPTGRLINRRGPYALHLDRVFQKAKETGTILELNSHPYRLDLNDIYLKKGKEEYGLTFSINTDAHAPEGFDFINMGVATARRGWLEPADVINTWPLDQLLERLNGNHS
ncbi:DNA polymerase/3'-5' exonuclease PolX [Salinithrix halophila]|uniref:DNA polymerase beta n=1 Tax=Salinithrix halophila TaxID=1485204 RepID=A0ABV8JB42_9BACL